MEEGARSKENSPRDDDPNFPTRSIDNQNVQNKRTKKGLSVVLRLAGVIAVIAGLVLILSGYTSHPIILTILSYVDQHFSSTMNPMELEVLKLAISIFNFLVGLGGTVVVLGGLALLIRHRGIGRSLVWIGGGMGIFGLLFTIGEAYYYSHFSLVVFHAEYWVGLVLATAAFVIAKRG